MLVGEYCLSEIHTNRLTRKLSEFVELFFLMLYKYKILLLAVQTFSEHLYFNLKRIGSGNILFLSYIVIRRFIL